MGDGGDTGGEEDEEGGASEWEDGVEGEEGDDTGRD